MSRLATHARSLNMSSASGTSLRGRPSAVNPLAKPQDERIYRSRQSRRSDAISLNQLVATAQNLRKLAKLIPFQRQSSPFEAKGLTRLAPITFATFIRLRRRTGSSIQSAQKRASGHRRLTPGLWQAWHRRFRPRHAGLPRGSLDGRGCRSSIGRTEGRASQRFNNAVEHQPIPTRSFAFSARF